MGFGVFVRCTAAWPAAVLSILYILVQFNFVLPFPICSSTPCRAEGISVFGSC